MGLDLWLGLTQPFTTRQDLGLTWDWDKTAWDRLDLDQTTQVTSLENSFEIRVLDEQKPIGSFLEMYLIHPVIYPLLIVKWHNIIGNFQSISRWLLWLFGGIFHLLINTSSPWHALKWSGSGAVHLFCQQVSSSPNASRGHQVGHAVNVADV